MSVLYFNIILAWFIILQFVSAFSSSSVISSSSSSCGVSAFPNEFVGLSRNSNKCLIRLHMNKDDRPDSICKNIAGPGSINNIPVNDRISSKRALNLGSLAVLGMAVLNIPAVYAKETGVQRPTLYGIEMTSPPCMVPRTTIGEESFLKRLLAAQIALIGIHSNAARDYLFLVSVDNPSAVVNMIDDCQSFER